VSTENTPADTETKEKEGEREREKEKEQWVMLRREPAEEKREEETTSSSSQEKEELNEREGICIRKRGLSFHLLNLHRLLRVRHG
jgi:hypothetical protein